MDRKTYKHSGKEYNGEKAIISLTSWKARINTVSKTLFSLIMMCPGFHIVLVLSEEEFPKMEKELPDELMLFIKYNLIEILWVYKNYKAFKKVLFTMDKYRELPVISADDDCIYICNYAQELYDEWLGNKDHFISCYAVKKFNTYHLGGAATLYPPYVFKEYGIKLLTEKIYYKTNQDDDYYTALRNILNLDRVVCIKKWMRNWKSLYFFHDEIKPLHIEVKGISDFERENIFNFVNKLVVEEWRKLYE